MRVPEFSNGARQIALELERQTKVEMGIAKFRIELECFTDLVDCFVIASGDDEIVSLVHIDYWRERIQLYCTRTFSNCFVKSS